MPDDLGNETEDERRLREALEELDKHDPEEVKQYLLESGILDTLIARLPELINSEDPLVREEIRQDLHKRQLGFLLAEHPEDP